MTYEDDRARIRESIKEGIWFEQDWDGPSIKDGDLTEKQISWLASWLAGDGFGTQVKSIPTAERCTKKNRGLQCLKRVHGRSENHDYGRGEGPPKDDAEREARAAKRKKAKARRKAKKAAERAHTQAVVQEALNTACPMPGCTAGPGLWCYLTGYGAEMHRTRTTLAEYRLEERADLDNLPLDERMRNGV